MYNFFGVFFGTGYFQRHTIFASFKSRFYDGTVTLNSVLKIKGGGKGNFYKYFNVSIKKIFLHMTARIHHPARSLLAYPAVRGTVLISSQKCQESVLWKRSWNRNQSQNRNLEQDQCSGFGSDRGKMIRLRFRFRLRNTDPYRAILKVSC